MTHGIMFHHFHNDTIHIKSQGSLSASDLEQLLDYYRKIYTIIPAKEYLQKAQSHSLSPYDVCITFDDALKCQYDIAYPILKKHNLTAFWYVYTSPLVGVAEKLEIYRHFRFLHFPDIDSFYNEFLRIALENDSTILKIKEKMDQFNPDTYALEFPFYSKNDKIFRNLRDNILGSTIYNAIMDKMLLRYHYDIKNNIRNLWLTNREIVDLHNNGNVLGLHSHTHPTTIGKMSYEQQLKEFKTNKTILEDIIGNSVTTVSYPCNSYNDDTLKIMQALNIQLGFRANMAQKNYTQLEFPREDHTNIFKEINNENNSIYK